MVLLFIDINTLPPTRRTNINYKMIHSIGVWNKKRIK